MKHILILIILLFSIKSMVFSKDIRKDIYEIHECLTIKNGDLDCSEETVNYYIHINSTLSFIYLLDRDNNTKVFSMDIISFKQINNHNWLYKLIGENGEKYNLTVNLETEIMKLSPIISVLDLNIRFRTFIFKYNNPIRL